MSDRGKAEFVVMDIGGSNLDQGLAQRPHIEKDLPKKQGNSFEALDDNMEVKGIEPEGLVSKGPANSAADRITRGVIGAITGAVPGAAIGVATADPEDRAGGAGRGALYGGLGGTTGGLLSKIGGGARTEKYLRGRGGNLESHAKREANRIPVAGAAGGIASEVLMDKGLKELSDNLIVEKSFEKLGNQEAKKLRDKEAAEATKPATDSIKGEAHGPQQAKPTNSAAQSVKPSRLKKIAVPVAIGGGLLAASYGIHRALKKDPEVKELDGNMAVDKGIKDFFKVRVASGHKIPIWEVTGVKNTGKFIKEHATPKNAAIAGTVAGAGVGGYKLGQQSEKDSKEEKSIETVPSAINTSPSSAVEDPRGESGANVPQSFASGNPIVQKKEAPQSYDRMGGNSGQIDKPTNMSSGESSGPGPTSGAPSQLTIPRGGTTSDAAYAGATKPGNVAINKGIGRGTPTQEFARPMDLKIKKKESLPEGAELEDPGTPNTASESDKAVSLVSGQNVNSQPSIAGQIDRAAADVPRDGLDSNPMGMKPSWDAAPTNTERKPGEPPSVEKGIFSFLSTPKNEEEMWDHHFKKIKRSHYDPETGTKLIKPTKYIEPGGPEGQGQVKAEYQQHTEKGIVGEVLEDLSVEKGIGSHLAAGGAGLAAGIAMTRPKVDNEADKPPMIRKLEELDKTRKPVNMKNTKMPLKKLKNLNPPKGNK